MPKKNLTILIVIALLIIIGVLILAFYSNKPAGNLTTFAQCLTQRGATMYGADWCPHCQQEKANFKDAWHFINYVECPANPQKCLDDGIDGYPAWIFPGGKKFVGYQGLEKLSQESGCPLQ